MIKIVFKNHLVSFTFILFSITISTIFAQENEIFKNGNLKVSSNGHFLEFKNGKPFFWLGDTGWLLFSKLNREEAEKYLQDRSSKGFNVIQAMVIHSIPEVNSYGDSAFINSDPTKPKVTKGNDPQNPEEYDFWDHIDFIVKLAEEKGIFIGMVAVWSSNVRDNKINLNNASVYATWLANRYKDKPNIIWINGGDTRGNQNTEVWNEIGNTIHRVDPNHLITFHPFGRTQSSTWFNDESWLSFNMFQSGHKDYSQDTVGFGEDNWKYVQIDYNKTPNKPTLDGEPSYESIPHGLHDPSMPYWKDDDVRRYAYWSVFAGTCGFTYGDNAVMQMHKPEDSKGAYGVKEFWDQALNDPGSSEMIYLKKLMLLEPYFERIPDQSIIADSNGTKYNYLAATKGSSYLFVYNYTGRKFKINMGKISGHFVNAYWYNPRNGTFTFIGKMANKSVKQFDPPGEMKEGNDWVLVVIDADKDFGGKK
jgi:hypothetical protein